MQLADPYSVFVKASQIAFADLQQLGFQARFATKYDQHEERDLKEVRNLIAVNHSLSAIGPII